MKICKLAQISLVLIVQIFTRFQLLPFYYIGLIISVFAFMHTLCVWYTYSHTYMKCVCCVTQSCPTLCDPMDCSLPGSPVHGILQVRTLEMPSSGGSSQPRDWTHVFCGSCIAGGFFTVWATREVHEMVYMCNILIFFWNIWDKL